MKLIVTIPVYNEEGCIEEVITTWHQYLLTIFKKDEFKIFLVNDGSKDNTPVILDRLSVEYENVIVKHQKNGGHGNAVLNAYRMAVAENPEWVFQTDSDNQFLPQDFEKLWNRRKESNFILGYRAKRYDEANRLVLTRIVRVVNLLLFRTFILDSNIPYRLMKGEYLKKLLVALPEYPFAPNIFFSILAKRDGQDVMSIPVTHKERKTGVVSIIQWKLLKVSLKTFRELFAFSFTISSRLKKMHAK